MTITSDEWERREQLGAALRQRRKAARVSLRALAEVIGVHHSHLSRVERGIDPASLRVRQAYEKYLGARDQAFSPISAEYIDPRGRRITKIYSDVVIELDEWANPQRLTTDLDLVALRDGVDNITTAYVPSEFRDHPPEVVGATVEYAETPYDGRFRQVIRFPHRLKKGDRHHIRLIESWFHELKRAEIAGGPAMMNLKRVTFVVQVPPAAASKIYIFRINHHVPYLGISDRTLGERLHISPAGRASTQFRNLDPGYGYGVVWKHVDEPVIRS